MRGGRAALPLAAAVAVAVVAGFVLGLPVLDLGSRVPRDLGDPVLNVWALTWESTALVRDPGALYDANIYWPETSTIALSESMLPLVPVFGLLRLLTGSPVAAHAVLAYVLVLGAVAAAYALGRRYVDRPGAALVGGLAYGLGSYVTAHAPQVQLLTLGSIPLVFLLWFRLVDRPTPGRGVACGAAIALAALSSLYYGVAVAPALLALAVVHLTMRRRWRHGATLASVALAAVVAIGLSVPGTLVYLDVDDRLGLDRPIEPALELELDDLVSAPRETLLYEDLAHIALAEPAATEHSLFPGFTTMALAVLGIGLAVSGRVVRRGAELGGLAAAAAVSFVLALGAEALGMDLPFGWLHEHVVGFDGIRATSRLVVPFLLFVCVLAGVALDRVVARFRPRAASLVTSGVLAVVVVELWAPVSWKEIPRGDAVEAVYEALDELPEGPVVELPMGDPRLRLDGGRTTWAFAEPTRMLRSLTDRNPRVNGFSGHFPPGYVSLVDAMNSFPSPAALTEVERLGVRYVVLHTGRASDDTIQYSRAETRAILAALPARWTADRHGSSWLLTTPD